MNSEMPSLEELAVRVRLLERKNRRLKHAALAGAAVVCTALAMGQGAQKDAASIPDVVRAREFCVVDAQGATAVTLKSYQHGGIVTVYDKTGRKMVELARLESVTGGRIETYNDAGNPMVSLCASESRGAGGIGVYNGEGAEMITLTVLPGSRLGAIQLKNAREKDLLRLTAIDGVGPGCVISYDGTGKQRARWPQ